MFGSIIINVLLIILYTIGLFIVFGFINELFNRLFIKLLGSKATKFQIVTGAIGTPVHECGHALFCLIFAHKITAIKLYDPSPDNGVLGYVNHTFNPKNFYQVIGNFFIGIGPLILGTGVLTGLFALMVSGSFFEISALPQTYLASGASGSAGWQMVYLGKSIGDVFAIVFSLDNLGSIWWWLYFIIGCPIALHMNLSPADIKGSWKGLLFTLAILIVIPLIIGLISYNALTAITNGLFVFALYQTCFFSMAFIAFAIMILMALIIRLIKSKTRRA